MFISCYLSKHAVNIEHRPTLGTGVHTSISTPTFVSSVGDFKLMTYLC